MQTLIDIMIYCAAIGVIVGLLIIFIEIIKMPNQK